MLRWLLNLPFLLLWNITYVLVQAILLMRRWLPPSLLLILVLVLPLLGLTLPRLDRAGSYLMVVAAIILAFLAGKLSRRK
jgi:hypothetical protein